MNGINQPVPTEEDEEWEILSREIKRKEHQTRMREAVASAQEFVESLTSAEIGIFTLRKAFEEGFMSGASWAKNPKDSYGKDT